MQKDSLQNLALFFFSGNIAHDKNDGRNNGIKSLFLISIFVSRGVLREDIEDKRDFCSLEQNVRLRLKRAEASTKVC